MVGITITTDESETEYLPIDVVHVVQCDIPRWMDLYNLQQFETMFADGYYSDREMGPWNFCVDEVGPQYFEGDEVQDQHSE